MTFAAPNSAPDPAPNPSPTPPIWTAPPKPRGSGMVFAIIGIVVTGFVGLLVLAYLAVGLGVPTLLIGSLLALVPLAMVLLAVRWVDRWEPEPRWALWFAFLWGAAVSVAIALIVDLGVQLAMAFAEPGGAPDEALQAVVQAPFVEEVAKGIGVLLIFAFSRSHFDGPVDGLVYAATVAAGFAFTENVLYFGEAFAEGGAETLGATFVVRGLFSPFAHVLFTACTGLAIGIGARRGGGAGVVGWFLLGLLGAIALHALWNGSLTFADDAIGLYLTVQVPIFIAAIGLTVLLRRQEVRVTRHRLAEYGAAGWFSPAEVEMLATPAGRRQAKAWAKAQTPPRIGVMRKLITDATHLAFTRQRIATGVASERTIVEEQGLLAAVVEDRRVLLS
ncbi:PrsW family intramembrane metalloprotease [Agromyces cerinus]|uniref:Membrane proteinase PrsW, cleaves anti-sigma factor RsiW, M82 family n=1 Tax=Agromyces cerinus subsp. cerinus TaxID=232089 RepID=A0A1N6HAJ4_9MICO|nr:PrsW family intramembrane metalloprotease [Agromyces cerinus]SIO16858.1 Membrane proteinase PrsW, cleaves anti-sigma factor RsiW, M82 family [Agromyces cerinus subsp. cerinus]